MNRGRFSCRCNLASIAALTWLVLTRSPTFFGIHRSSGYRGWRMGVLIIGAGGLGREVLATLRLAGKSVDGFLVDPEYT